MLTKQEFKTKFDQEFSKEKRIFVKNKIFSVLWMIIGTMLVVGACVGFHYLFDPQNENWIILVFAGIIGWFVVAALPILFFKDKLVKSYKKLDMGKLLSLIVDDKIFYLHEGYVPQNLFEISNFVENSFDTYAGEDLFAFEIKRIRNQKELTTHFVASDILAERTVFDSSGKPEKKTIFDGIFCAIQFSNPFKCTLEINAVKKPNLQQLKTESSEFDKKFIAQTNNQIESRLILTPSLMEKLLKIGKDKMGLVFREHYLFIYFKRELFSLSKKDDKFNFELVESVYDDIALLHSIAEEIENNAKIFKI